MQGDNSQILARNPSGKTIALKLPSQYESLIFATSTDTRGTWLLHGLGQRRLNLVGVFNASSMEQMGETLLFTSQLDDVGEEIGLIVHPGGLLVLRLCLSPSKCPIEIYRKYVESYVRLFICPKPGPRTVSGAISSVGRQPTPDEYTYHLIESAVFIDQLASRVQSDIQTHERGLGGEVGVDPVQTLEAWKRHPDWYRKAFAGDRVMVKVGDMVVTPLRVVPRLTQSTNKFIGATCAALMSLEDSISNTVPGRLATVFLSHAKGHLARIETGTSMGTRDAWTYLASARLVGYSKQLAISLSKFRRMISTPPPFVPISEGTLPYYLPPPEIVFQKYAIAAVLVALGLPIEQIPLAQIRLGTEQGYSFGQYTAWSDTPKHGVPGWRDMSSYPSGYRPDLIVHDIAGNKWLLLDAKLRRSEESGRMLSASSVRDMQAYMQEYQLDRAVTVIPHLEGDSPYEDIKGGQCWIRGIPIPPGIETVSEVPLSVLLEQLWNV